jgi:LysM repeat protein
MRSKVVVVSLISLLLMKEVRAQSDELLVQGQTGDLHLQHTVQAKENWYSLGRTFNLTAKELAAYNKLAMTQPLSIGQQLQVPLIAANFSQNAQKTGGESLVPLYYVIQEKEWMYRISVNHNKVPIPSLEKWNNINKDQVKPGMHIIVGYLKVKTALSALATRTAEAPVITGTPGSVSTAPPTGNAGNAGKQAESVAKTTNKAAGKVADQPVEKSIEKPLNKSAEKAVDKSAEKPLDKSAEKSPDKPADKPLGKSADKPLDKSADKPLDKPAPTISQPVEKPVSASGKSFNGGFFKTEFTDGGKNTDGIAGIFKSSSGWQDGKYYALMNNIPVGTIVKVTVGASGKSIYAKILGQLPDMKESAGLSIRISNAAASELGEADGKFNVSVKY